MRPPPACPFATDPYISVREGLLTWTSKVFALPNSPLLVCVNAASGDVWVALGSVELLLELVDEELLDDGVLPDELPVVLPVVVFVLLLEVLLELVLLLDDELLVDDEDEPAL
jgi:hypothetical protein